MSNKEIRKARSKITAEIFTPAELVNDMLAKLPFTLWEEGKTFCDPCVGNGNFLVAILIRKIQMGHNPVKSLDSIYGVDIMEDNIRECRLRLLQTLSVFGEKIDKEHIAIVCKNIAWTDISEYPQGSLEYDFQFKANQTQVENQTWLEWIDSNNLFNNQVLPVNGQHVLDGEIDFDDKC